MAFWSSEKIRERLQDFPLVDPPNQRRIKYGAYELSLGLEAFVTSHPEGKKERHRKEEQVVIPPGQFCLLITDEVVSIPINTIGFISIKAGIKFRGLVNVSGFHVDPGFKGRLKFSVYNAGSQNIILSRGQPVFLLWFGDLDRQTQDVYVGDHQNQMNISSEDVMRIQGKVASPAELEKRLTSLEIHFKILITAACAVAVGILITLLKVFLN